MFTVNQYTTHIFINSTLLVKGLDTPPLVFYLRLYYFQHYTFDITQ